MQINDSTAGQEPATVTMPVWSLEALEGANRPEGLGKLVRFASQFVAQIVGDSFAPALYDSDLVLLEPRVEAARDGDLVIAILTDLRRTVCHILKIDAGAQRLEPWRGEAAPVGRFVIAGIVRRVMREPARDLALRGFSTTMTASLAL